MRLRRATLDENACHAVRCALQVTHARANTIELRAIADARDAGTAWDLRCAIRESLINFLQEKYPQRLPKTRAELNSLPEQMNARKEMTGQA